MAAGEVLKRGAVSPLAAAPASEQIRLRPLTTFIRFESIALETVHTSFESAEGALERVDLPLERPHRG
jgi:hypothetical protein